MSLTPLDDLPNLPEDCECEFTPYPQKKYEEKSWHYLRRCPICNKTWYSLHCPHEGPRCCSEECRRLSKRRIQMVNLYCVRMKDENLQAYYLIHEESNKDLLELHREYIKDGESIGIDGFVSWLMSNKGFKLILHSHIPKTLVLEV